MVRHDERRGLQPMNQRVGLWQTPIGVRLIPHPVEPNAANRPIIREQLGELRVKEVEIAIPVATFGPDGGANGPATRAVILRMPCAPRIAEEQLDALAL